MAYLVAAILYELQVVLFNKTGSTMASLDADCDMLQMCRCATVFSIILKQFKFSIQCSSAVMDVTICLQKLLAKTSVFLLTLQFYYFINLFITRIQRGMNRGCSF